MAVKTDVTLWIGTDMSLVFTIKNAAETAILDSSGWALSWMLKKKLTDTDANAKITKTSGSGITVSGTFNSDPDTNTQVATVAVADTDSDSLVAGAYEHELKRTDAGSETVLAYGTATLKRGVHRT